ncbi:MAG: NUDIX domain-containing protein [Candidatus Uhrbacteria bacterium]|nr:NUDIX domain-containing protein [Candidatus Uhrbacteria bacterium]
MQEPFRCVLHGSFGKHFDEIQRIHRLFTQAGIEVLAPEASNVARVEAGFAMLESDREQDPRVIELLYLHHLKRLGDNGFSYFVNPGGYIGKSAAYELGIAQATNVPCFFVDKLDDHPAYVPQNAIWPPELLVEYILEYGVLPEFCGAPNATRIHRMWQELLVPGSIVAVGGIIEYDGHDAYEEKEVLFVETHKWKGRFSVIGGKVRKRERLHDALRREVKEETGLDGKIGRHLCTFDQIKDSGYYMQGVSQVFVDNIVTVDSRRVQLNDEAEDYVWMPPRMALKHLPLEPNARHTLERYTAMLA